MKPREENQPELPKDELEELYEFAPCGYISTMPDGRIVRVNETFVKQIGRSRNELLAGVKFPELMTRAGRVFWDTHFAPLIRIQGFVKEIACDLEHPGKGKIPVLVNAVQVETAGLPSGMRFTVFDATERRRYEADLLAARRRAEHFRTIVQISADAILSVDATGLIKTWNCGAETMFGIKESDAVGRKAWDVIDLAHGKAAYPECIEHLRAGRPVLHLDVANVGSGKQINVSVSLTPHIEPPGELTGVSAIIRDITERLRTEESRHKQELLENLIESQEAERQRFARDLHDHLGQRLTGLRLSLANLKNRSNAGLAPVIENIQEQASQIDRDLSFVAFELRPNVLNELGLVEALENFVSEWSGNYAKNARFHHAGLTENRLIPAIEINIYRIAQEALNNIVKHANAENVSVILEVRKDEIRLIVEDDGEGFALDQAGKLVKISGHGLGLLGMRERAAVIGGELEIESQPGGGTTVFVRAPIAYE